MWQLFILKVFLSATKTVKHKITKKQEGKFLGAIMAPMIAPLIAPMASSLLQPVASSMINPTIGKGVMRAGKGQAAWFLPLFALPWMMKVLVKRVTRTGRGYNRMDHLDKNV